MGDKKYKSLQDMLSFKGKRALITGSAGGIGEAAAIRFAEAGADLQLVDINLEGLEKVKNKIHEKYKVEIEIFRVDLSNKAEIDNLWETIKGREPDILVNNAGIYPFKDYEKIDESFYKKVMDINFSSIFWMCQHMITARKKKGGHIVNIGTIEAILPFEADLVHYSLSKAAVIALSRSLARKYGNKGFHVNVILPGGISTPGTRDKLKDALTGEFGLIKSGIEFKWRLPAGRMGDPDEVARMILVLSSDFASYMYGAIVPVDGGFLST